MDGTIGSDYVIKPMPSNVELSAAHLDELSARDDDEMFLDEDEFGSMSAPSHQTNSKAAGKSASGRSKPTSSQTTGQVTVSKVEQSALNHSDLADGARQPYSSSHVPKLHKLDEDGEEDERQALKLKKLKKLERRKQLEHGAHIVYKKWKAPKESHSDFIELEPGSHGFHGHFVPNSNWTLLHQFPKRQPSVSTPPAVHRYPSNHSNQGVQFDENLYDELELAHSFDSMRYASPAGGQQAHRRSKRQAPDTVWPEVLLVVDYDSYLLHGANSRDVKRYFISFWNGVDLRYKLLSHPTIRISLAGMIVAKVRTDFSLNAECVW